MRVIGQFVFRAMYSKISGFGTIFRLFGMPTLLLIVYAASHRNANAVILLVALLYVLILNWRLAIASISESNLSLIQYTGSRVVPLSAIKKVEARTSGKDPGIFITYLWKSSLVKVQIQPKGGAGNGPYWQAYELFSTYAESASHDFDQNEASVRERHRRIASYIWIAVAIVVLLIFSLERL